MSRHERRHPPDPDRHEAAALLDVHVATVDRYLRQGLLPRIKIGPRRVRIPRAAVEAMLAGVPYER